MAATTIALLLGFAAAIGYGTSDFFGARSSRHLGPVTASLCVHVIGAVLVCIWYFAFVHHVPYVTGEAFASIALGASAIGIGAVLLYKAFQVGPVGLTSVLGAAYPLVTAGTGLLLFHARFTAGQLTGVALLVLGIMVASGLVRLKGADHRFGKGPALALMTSVLWGVGFSFLDHAVDLAGWQTVIFLQVLLILPVIGVIWLFTARKEKITPGALTRVFKDPFVIGAGIIQIVADFIVNLGFIFDPAAGTLVVATSACYPVITGLFALRHFKERIETVPLLGAFATIGGVVFLLI